MANSLHNSVLVAATWLIAATIPAAGWAQEAETSATPLSDGKGDLRAEGAVVIDAFTGEMLYGKNAHKRLFPASTTKILTALLVIEAGGLDGEVTVAEPETKAEPSKLYIKVGEKYTRREMLYAIMLKSANDVAEALARDNAGSVEAFGRKMTVRALELGALGSQFRNPHGLPDKNHYSTAYDLALIARAAMAQPFFRRIASTKTHEWISPRGATPLYNKNKLLSRFEGATGLKTGWTIASKHTLVSAALRERREVIAVVLKTDRIGIWQDSRRLLEFGLQHVPDLPVRDKYIRHVSVNPPH